MGDGLAALPERLLLAHARGEVLFICGAGISRPAGLPDFRELVLKVYEELDASTYNVLAKLPQGACNQWQLNCKELTDLQTAEVKRFIVGDYDVVLGMLERRIDRSKFVVTMVLAPPRSERAMSALWIADGLALPERKILATARRTWLSSRV